MMEIITPEEIADAVRFILAAPAMTGQMIALDGGEHLGSVPPRETEERAPMTDLAPPDESP